ncbi:MAG: sulfatase-like hydrolase/transferase [Acidobacteria bacterium]|nr:sulfatase-like hydrolase/transferase [Acidobacteriota bacterium]
MKRLFLFVFLLFLLAGCSPVPPPSNAARPNIVIVLADDQGWGDLSIHGNTNLSTPQIDSIGEDGALFDRFYVSPVCSPTRAELLTGRYHAHGGVGGVSRGEERLDLDERTIAEAFQAAGYHTAAFGKWHNGTQSPYRPNDRGFDEYYGFTSGHWGEYFSPLLEHNATLTKGEGFIIDDLTNHALSFMEEHKSEPFFVYLPYNTPHSPMDVPDEYWDRFKDKELAMRNRDPERESIPVTRAALAMVENIDWNVGRVLAKLDDLQLAENTIVLYFSDNGPNSYRWNDDMKGRKGSVDEGGVRSPLLVRWPGHIAPGTKIDRIAAAIDLLPTLTDLAGIERVGDKPLDGRSLRPLLLGEDAAWPDRTLFTEWGRRVSLRTQQFRLDNDGALFDMTADPGQRLDVSSQHPDVAEKLRGELETWRQMCLREIGESSERPFTVGYADLTMLPARDGEPHDGVERSAKAPNCSFFTNWTSTKGSMTWNVEVGSAGRYQAVVHYTCAEGDVGSTIELSLGDAKVSAQITEAFDPPLRGAEHDRTPRGSESYVKDFKPLELGELDLPAGRGTLTLKALDVAGKQVADVRFVMLKKVK